MVECYTIYNERGQKNYRNLLNFSLTSETNVTITEFDIEKCFCNVFFTFTFYDSFYQLILAASPACSIDLMCNFSMMNDHSLRLPSRPSPIYLGVDLLCLHSPSRTVFCSLEHCLVLFASSSSHRSFVKRICPFVPVEHGFLLNRLYLIYKNLLFHNI